MFWPPEGGEAGPSVGFHRTLTEQNGGETGSGGMQRVGGSLPTWIACCLGRGSLAPLALEDVEELASNLVERAVPQGEYLFRIGEAPARVHILRAGAVELSRQLGRRRVVLHVLRPGDVFGDVPLLVRVSEPFDARALEDSVVASIDSVALMQLLERRPKLGHRWLVSVATRMAATQARLVDLLAGSLEAQVASMLCSQAQAGEICLSQDELAQLLGTVRTSVNRVLQHLERDHLIRRCYGRVEVLDPERLALVATGSEG